MVGPRAHTRTHTHTHTHTHTLRHLLVKSSFKSRDIAGCFLRVRHPLHVRTTNQVVHVGQWSERLDSPGPVGNDCTLGGCCFNDSIMQNVLHGGRGGGPTPCLPARYSASQGRRGGRGHRCAMQEQGFIFMPWRKTSACLYKYICTYGEKYS